MDINADQEKIKVTLSELQYILDELQKRAFQYKSYQKNFKVMTAIPACSYKVHLSTRIFHVIINLEFLHNCV